MRLLAALVLISAISCAGTPPRVLTETETLRTVNAAPAQVVTAAIAVFAEAGIPVASSDREAGTIQSQQFTVERVWGGEPIAARVDCGKDEVGVERTLLSGVVMSIAMVARPIDTQSSTVRLTANGSAFNRVAQGMASTNAAAAAQSGGFPCTLTANFTAQLLDAIQQEAEG
jgi:hypothetical protein